MKNTTVLARDKSVVRENVTVELNRVGMCVVGITSILIGSWAVTCLVSGMVLSGGPVSLVSNFILSFVG